MQESTASPNYYPLLIVRDPRFNISQLHQYHLAIQVSDSHLKVSCTEPSTRKCLLLVAYQLAPSQAHRRVRTLEQIYRDHPLLSAESWAAVTLAIENQQYTLVPERLFSADKAVQYLQFACPRTYHTVQHFVHPTLNVATVFAAEPSLLHWFRKTYPSPPLRTIHQASSLLEGVWSYFQERRIDITPKIFAFVQPTHLHITAMQRGNLLYYNRFQYANSDELLHYILIVMRTLKLDTSFHEVILGGDIAKNSLAYRKARNYIRNLTLSSPPPHLRFRRAFKKKLIASHFDVLSAHLC
ncbi:MAG: DUF3822 family protein [Bacteroidota bacterium]